MSRAAGPRKERLSIGEVARRAGLAASAIRYYEAEGLLPEAGRVAGRRVYDAAILDQLMFIELSKRSGFTIAEIRRLVAGFGRGAPPGVRWRSLAARKRADLEKRIAEAEEMKSILDAMTDCECPSFRDCVEALDSQA